MASNLSRRIVSSSTRSTLSHIYESLTRGTPNSVGSYLMMSSATSDRTSSKFEDPKGVKEEVTQEREKDEVDDDDDEDDDDDDDGGVYVNKETGEVGGPRGPEPTRFGDWEKGGRCSDF
ncbi:hypothetical protein RND81_14G211500 [Saponaria officinalis]|uniref:Succinate dehydrogenase assembly factor 4, mitochondrial n=1 Tax=Saponaria officinalis TaxID=3572 RepID=A0AAW1GTI0_SAPOF